MKALDLTGQVFGELTAQTTLTIDKKRGWNCICSCGKSKWIPTFQLTNSNNKTCGDGMHKQSIKEGDRFGQLTVLSMYRDTKNSRYMSICKCDCGNTKSNVSIRNLQRKSATHCGCLTDFRNMGLPEGQAALNGLISTYKSNARHKSFAFELTKDDCVSLFNGDCYFCGQPPSETFKKKGIKGSYTYSSIDRIDSTLGYTTNNVMSCCTACNYLKSNRTNTSFINHIKRIAKHLS